MVEYFNGIDEKIREIAKSHVNFLDTSEAYAKINSGSNIDNPDYIENNEIDAIKTKRYNDIDLKSQYLISLGVPHALKTFSMSIPAQLNLTGIKARKNNNELTLPFELSTKDNNKHTFQNANELDSFIDDAFDFMNGILGGGRDLKALINTETTMAGIKAIVDNR